MLEYWNIEKRLEVSFWVSFVPIIPLLHYSNRIYGTMY
jgi:hypothetical protein